MEIVTMSENLTCPVCRKDFTGYVLCATKNCSRCRKFVPFLLEREKVDPRRALWLWEV